MSGEESARSARTHPNPAGQQDRPPDDPESRPAPEREGLRSANSARGEASILVNGETLVLRPSFAALVAAEGELGSLFGLVERAAEGGLRLGEIAGLFWHLMADRPAGCTREDVGEAVVAAGLARVTPVLRVVLGQILQGR